MEISDLGDALSSTRIGHYHAGVDRKGFAFRQVFPRTARDHSFEQLRSRLLTRNRP
jgi:hypothetical protein